MTIAVIGSSGFIGAAIVKELVKLKLNVLGFDHSCNSFEDQKFKFFEMSILDVNSVSISDFVGVKTVIYLVSTTTPSSSMTNISGDVSDNLISFIRFLEFVSSLKIERFIFSSSGGAIYSDINKLPYSEHDTLDPITPYGINKVASEFYLNLFANKYGFTAINLRISNPYGPGQKSKSGFGVVPVFFENVLKEREIVVYGGDIPHRDFIFIDDVVRAFIKAIYYSGQNVTLNIGSGKPLSILNLVSYIEKVVGKASISKIEPLRPYDKRSVYLDISQAMKILDWEPVISIEYGLESYFDWLNMKVS